MSDKKELSLDELEVSGGNNHNIKVMHLKCMTITELTSDKKKEEHGVHYYYCDECKGWFPLKEFNRTR